MQDEELEEIELEEEDDGLTPEEEPEEQAAEPEEEQAAGDSGAEDGEELFTLKLDQEERKLKREELFELARKGAGFDRLKTQQEQEAAAYRQFLRENGGALDWLGSMAKEAGKPPAELLKDVHYRRTVDKLVERGMDQSSAEIAARELTEQEAARRTAQPRAETENDRFARESQEFLRSHQGVKAEEIPKEVFERFRSGENLSRAYDAVMGKRRLGELEAENKRLKEELEAAKQNGRNRRRSLGSQSASGASKGADPFMAALLADD